MRTKRHYEVLDAIRAFKKVNGYSPSYRNLMEMVNISSPSNVQYYLDKLEDEGLIRRSKRLSRSIELTGATSRRWSHEVYEQRARVIGERDADGRKFVSEETAEKRKEAARQSRGGDAFAPRKSRRNADIQKRIEDVVAYAEMKAVPDDVIFGAVLSFQRLPIGACKLG